MGRKPIRCRFLVAIVVVIAVCRHDGYAASGAAGIASSDCIHDVGELRFWLVGCIRITFCKPTSRCLSCFDQCIGDLSPADRGSIRRFPRTSTGFRCYLVTVSGRVIVWSMEYRFSLVEKVALPAARGNEVSNVAPSINCTAPVGVVMTPFTAAVSVTRWA